MIYLKRVFRELRVIKWASFSQSLTISLIILVIIIVFAIVFALLQHSVFLLFQ